MPTVVKIATPEQSANATLIVFSTLLRALYCFSTRFFAQTKPSNAAQITTANLAKAPIV